MTRFVSKEWKALEQIIRENKIKEISLEMVKTGTNGFCFRVNGDGKTLYESVYSNWKLPTAFFKLKLKEKKEFPLELSSIEVNLGIVKAKFNKKTKD